MQEDLEGEFLAEDILAEQVVGVKLIDGFLQVTIRFSVFIPKVYVSDAGLGRVARHQDAFKNLVRVLLHENAVVKRAWLRLVCVDTKEDRPRMIGWQESPLDAARKARP